MPARYFCAAEGCQSDTLKRGRYGFMASVDFFPFPTKLKDPKARKKWLDLLRRKDYDPKRKHRVCSLHFVDGNPTKENPYPTLFSYNKFKYSRNARPITSIIKRDRACTSSTSTSDNEAEDFSIHSNTSFYSNGLHVTSHYNVDLPVHQDCMPICQEVEVSTTISSTLQINDCIGKTEVLQHSQDHNYDCNSKNDQTPQSCSTGCQTDLTMTDIDALLDAQTKLENPDSLLKDLFMEKVTHDDEIVRKYTGTPSKHLLNGVFDVLNSSSRNLKYWSGQGSSTIEDYQRHPDRKKSGPHRKLSRYEEFILTLVRLRLGMLSFILADIFGISGTRVSQIVTTWVNFMNSVLGPMIKWPSSDTVKKFMPNCFKLTFPNTRCIIDCTEFFICRPKSPTAQCQTFSAYKHHNTFKALIGISPSGAITFVSKLWGGNTSDRYITKESGFLDLIEPGDEILADRGFLIRDLLLERRAKLVIPPFTKKCTWGKGKRLSSSDVGKTQNIARLRIHVERAIERLKNFRILSNTMSLKSKPVSNQMLTVCAFLCNLQGPLVKK